MDFDCIKSCCEVEDGPPSLSTKFLLLNTYVTLEHWWDCGDFIQLAIVLTNAPLQWAFRSLVCIFCCWLWWKVKFTWYSCRYALVVYPMFQFIECQASALMNFLRKCCWRYTFDLVCVYAYNYASFQHLVEDTIEVRTL